MAIETTNPGYIAAAAYAADPSSLEVPDPFHAQFDIGILSYLISQAGVQANTGVRLGIINYASPTVAGTGIDTAFLVNGLATTPRNDELGILAFTQSDSIDVANIPSGYELSIITQFNIQFAAVAAAARLSLLVNGVDVVQNKAVIDYDTVGIPYTTTQMKAQSSGDISMTYNFPLGDTISLASIFMAVDLVPAAV